MPLSWGCVVIHIYIGFSAAAASVALIHTGILRIPVGMRSSVLQVYLGLLPTTAVRVQLYDARVFVRLSRAFCVFTRTRYIPRKYW